ncbi:MAG: MBL fold metallo-hydrolase [Candidatus Hermodarchaeota archaeon]
MENVKLTIIFDDLNGAKVGYLKSFGFSLLIELNSHKILFDTGTKAEILLKNLSNYAVNPSDIKYVILSHNHYDHANGLSGILMFNPDVRVYIHKHWKKPVKKIGDTFPDKNMIFVEKGGKINEIGDNLYITNAYKSPDYGGIYEQACYIKTKDSLILISGCCHPGLKSFLADRKVLGISEKKPLHIIGGFHRFKFTSDDATALNPYIHSIVLCHCTKNIEIFKNQFKEKCSLGVLGKTLLF